MTRTLKQKIAALALASLLGGSLLIPLNVNAADLSSIERMAGPTKNQTALEIALKLNQGRAPAVVLAAPTGFSDALAGIPLAKQKEAPLLWVGRTPQESKEVFNFIKDHCDKKGIIYILGSEGIIPGSFETALQDLGYKKEQIQRFGGSNRYETAVKIAQSVEYKGNPIILTDGEDYSQAAGAAVLAAAQESPILVIPAKGNLPESMIDYLNAMVTEKGASLQIIGNATVFPDALLAELKSKLKGLDPEEVEHLSGEDLYDLTAKVNKRAWLTSQEEAGQEALPRGILTTGKSYADGIAGAVLAARVEAPLIFVSENLPEASTSLLKDIYLWNKQRDSSLQQLTVLGGTGALSPQTVAETDSLLILGQSMKGKAQVWTYAELHPFSVPFYGVQGSGNAVIVSDAQSHTLQVINGEKDVTGLTSQSSATDEYGMPVGGYRDGSAAEAMFNSPKGIARDEAGVLYVADSANGAVRTLDPRGNVNTLVTGLNCPTGIVLGNEGDIYVTETLNHRILKIDTQGLWTVLAGGSYTLKEGETVGAFADGKGEQAQFNEPQGIARDDEGNLYVADSGNQRIRKITPEGIVTTLAGSGKEAIENTSYLAGGYQDGDGKNAQFNFPLGLAVGKDKTVYVADSLNHCIRKITSEGVVSTLAGAADPGKGDGSAVLAQFNTPSDILLREDGSLLIVDQGNALLRVYLPPR